ncbi:MAG: hypothetical protein HY049_04350 [Acidobacteria bacterium]|nr:hypothetical protein [Acidobacteriota bacterium]
MASGQPSVAETMVAQPVPPMPTRPKALICKTGPAEALDACMMKIGREVDLEALDTLAEGMERCLRGGVDILFVNLFSFTARELTAIAAFRSLRPLQPVVAVAGPEMRNAFVGSSLFDDVRIVPTASEGFIHPQA